MIERDTTRIIKFYITYFIYLFHALLKQVLPHWKRQRIDYLSNNETFYQFH